MDLAGPQVPKLPSGAFWRLPPEEPAHEPTPEHRTAAPGIPAIQVGGDGKGSCSPAGELLQFMRWRHKTARHANTNLDHLPPAAVKEARNL